MKQIEIARMGALPVKLTQSLINGRSRIIYLVNFLNLTSGQPLTFVQVVRQQNELGIPKRTTVSVEPCIMVLSGWLFITKTTIPHWWLSHTLRWRHSGSESVSNHQPHDCLLNGLFRRRSKKTWKLCVTGLCAGKSPGPVNSPHKWPVTRKMFPFDDVIMMRGLRSGTFSLDNRAAAT